MRDPVFSRFSRKPTCDRQTQTQTQGHGIYRASIASRGKEIVDIGRYLLKLFESFVGVRVFSKHGVEVSERPC